MSTEKLRLELINNISETAFTLDELRLFLDTHADCGAALKDYNECSLKYKKLVKEYNDQFGPLSYYDPTCPKEWQWVSYPWPWEGEC